MRVYSWKRRNLYSNVILQENREQCAAATGPLLEAVRQLQQFADSPDFASIPARISPQGYAQQEPILECGRSIISSSCAMLEAAKALALSPQERSQWQLLAAHSKSVSDSIKGLVTNIREKAPGQKECTTALESIANLMRTLDRAAIQAAARELPPSTANTLQGYTEQIENSASEMLERLEPLRIAANGEAENLGHCAVQLVPYAEAIVSGSVGSGSLLAEPQGQSLLGHGRTVLEATAALLAAARDSAGNHRALKAHAEVDAQTSLTRAALTELAGHVRELGAQRGAVGSLLDQIARATARLTHTRLSLVGGLDDEGTSFVEYQARMMDAAKEIATLATDMTARAATDASRVVEVCRDMCARYERLARDAAGAAAATPTEDVAASIRSSVVDLGDAISSATEAAASCQASPTPQARQQVAAAARNVTEKVGGVLGSLQACSRGTQACIDAAAAIAAVVQDLDTAVLFASAGTLHSDKETDTFSDHRENILKTAKTLVEDTKTLVGGAAGTQDQLAAAAQCAVNTIVQLCEVVKLGAASLGSADGAEPQVLLLHAARDVAAALRDLARATTAASGKHHHHPDMQRLKHAAKVMVTNVTSLLKTVKVVEDEHTRGTRALESTIEAISQEIEVLLSNTPPKGTASPEDLVRCTRQMTAATAGAVAAGSAGADRQHQLTAAANQGRKAVTDLLLTCKAAAWSAESSEIRQRTLEVGAAAAEAYRALMSGVLAAVTGGGDRHAFPELSRKVALAVADIIAVAESLKGSEWVDPADPTVIAEGELLGAAASIDAAARKLDALRPRKHRPQETDESLNFDEMILEAAKSIIAATSALVRAASAAQRELIDQGKVCGRPSASSDDGQWSEGLVSAARMVAAAAHALVESANALVQGAASEDRLASSARQVAASTAHLLVACKVKADPNSESTRRLQAAGAEVIRSTDGLVRAARDAIQCDEERSLVLNRRMVGGIAQEIDARSEVLRIEKELEEARGRLTAIRQAKYRLRAADSSAEDTDTDHLYVDSTRVKSPTSSFANTTYSPNSSYTPNHTQNTTNLSQNISNLSQSIHGTPNAYNHSQTGLNQNYNQTSYNQSQTSYNPNHTGYNPNQTGYNQNQTGYIPNQTSYSQSQTGYNQSQTIYSQSQIGQTNGYNQYHNEKQYTAQSPTFSSFRPQDDTPKQSYEGFTTRSIITVASTEVA
ncbi:hypothetical protein ACJJTC_010999 [Scirpophaga incertulas]